MLANASARALARLARQPTTQRLAWAAAAPAVHQRRWDSSASSTSAITFKLHRHRRHLPPLPTAPQPTAEEAVTNILYNTPDSSTQPSQRRVLSCLVQDEPGVLSRVSGILAGRGFNIESLVVSKTEVRDLSRMTIIVKGQEAVVEQARRQLEDLVPVWAVIDYTGARLVERELLLVKVSTLGPEQELERQRQLQRAAAGDLTAQEAEASHRENASTKLPPPSVMLRETQDNLRALSELANLFRGRVVDVSAGSVVLELCAKSNRIEAFVKLIQPFGILEAARSGVMAMPRAYMPGQEDADANAPTASEPTVDATMLPPG